MTRVEYVCSNKYTTFLDLRPLCLIVFFVLSVLKDVPLIPQESSAPRQEDSLRLSVFPNLNYSGLHDAVLSIISLLPRVQYGQHSKTTF